MGHDDASAGKRVLVRTADPLIAAQVWSALGDAKTVLNVSVGTDAYAPANLDVVGFSPTPPGPPGTDRSVHDATEALPFEDDSFDAAMSVLSTHHFEAWQTTVREMRRVAEDRVVILIWDPLASRGFWLHEYIPGLTEFDEKRFCSVQQLEPIVGPCRVEVVPVPHDCADGFLGAFWRRPWKYLDPDVRARMSSLSQDGVRDQVDDGIARLREDLDNGDWRARWGHLTELDSLDLGYRLVITEP